MFYWEFQVVKDWAGQLPSDRFVLARKFLVMRTTEPGIGGSHTKDSHTPSLSQSRGVAVMTGAHVLCVKPLVQRLFLCFFVLLSWPQNFCSSEVWGANTTQNECELKSGAGYHLDTSCASAQRTRRLKPQIASKWKAEGWEWQMTLHLSDCPAAAAS